MGLTICINRNNYADNTQISNRNRLLICIPLATEHSFNISFMRRIENEEFNRIRNTLLTLYKDKKCPVNKYFYYCRTEPSKEYAASKLFDDFPLELNEKILL